MQRTQTPQETLKENIENYYSKYFLQNSMVIKAVA